MARTFNRRDNYCTYKEAFLDFNDDSESNPMVIRYRQRYTRYSKSGVIVHKQNREKYYLLIMLHGGSFFPPFNENEDSDDYAADDYAADANEAFDKVLAHLCPDYYINPRIPLLCLNDYYEWLEQRRGN